MSKYLFKSSVLQGMRNHPLDFSISNSFVIDVDSSLPFVLPYDLNLTATDLIAAKVEAYQKKYQRYSSIEYDEYLSFTSPVDIAESDLFSFGPYKKTQIFPGGSLVTDPIVIGSGITNVFSHWYGFLLHQDTGITCPNPDPNRVLYNYNPLTSQFQEFNPATFTAEIRNSTNNSTLLTLKSDTEQALVFGPGSIRLRFTNTHPTLTYYISDWVLMF